MPSGLTLAGRLPLTPETTAWTARSAPVASRMALRAMSRLSGRLNFCCKMSLAKARIRTPSRISVSLPELSRAATLGSFCLIRDDICRQAFETVSSEILTLGWDSPPLAAGAAAGGFGTAEATDTADGLGAGRGAETTSICCWGFSSISAKASSRPSEGDHPPRGSVAAALKARIMRKTSTLCKALACLTIWARVSLGTST